MKHLPQHRQELSQWMDALTLEHDELHQILTDQTRQPGLSFLPRVDRWESRSIEKIKQVEAKSEQNVDRWRVTRKSS